jgi:hypothetical protein
MNFLIWSVSHIFSLLSLTLLAARKVFVLPHCGYMVNSAEAGSCFKHIIYGNGCSHCCWHVFCTKFIYWLELTAYQHKGIPKVKAKPNDKCLDSSHITNPSAVASSTGQLIDARNKEAITFLAKHWVKPCENQPNQSMQELLAEDFDSIVAFPDDDSMLPIIYHCLKLVPNTRMRTRRKFFPRGQLQNTCCKKAHCNEGSWWEACFKEEVERELWIRQPVLRGGGRREREDLAKKPPVRKFNEK